MEPNKADAKVPQPAQRLPTFDLEEVQKHDKEVSCFGLSFDYDFLSPLAQDDAWMILDNKVYDLSGRYGPSYKPMLAQHPGQSPARNCASSSVRLMHFSFLSQGVLRFC